jgi:hypothetical protein
MFPGVCEFGPAARKNSQLFLGEVMKRDEMIVKKNDFGLLVDEFIRVCLRPGSNISAEWVNENLRRWWPTLEEYYQRHIMSAIEVALALDEPPRYSRESMDSFAKFMWKKIVADLRPPKAVFTVDYHCHKCQTKEVKLWRGVHGCLDKNEHGLLCAACLAPGIVIDDEGKWQEPDRQINGNAISGMRTDQVKGWLPAIPVDDTYWGYSSVPSQDVEWWIKLPTYKK